MSFNHKNHFKIPKHFQNIKANINSNKILLNKGKVSINTNNSYSQYNQTESNNKIALTNRDMILNNDKNPTNTNLFVKIKKLLLDFQKENADKNRHFIYKRKGSKKSKKNESSKRNSKSYSLLVPQKKIYYAIPKVKNQMQLNHYLINDFKEVGSEQEYITRSLKYQKMNDDLDELVFMNQIKEAEKIGISDNIMKEYEKKNDFSENEKNSNLNDFELDSNQKNKDNSNNINDLKKKKIINKRNSVFSKNNYDLLMRKLYKENTNISNKSEYLKSKSNNIKMNNIFALELNQNNGIINPSITSRTKNTENENLLLESIDSNKMKSGIKFLMDKKHQKVNLKMNLINSDINIKKNEEEQINKTIKPKKEKIKIKFDKYEFSNKLYKEKKLEYNKYIKNKYIMRGHNFAMQIGLLLKEKDKFGINDNESENENYNENKRHPKLNHIKLLYQIQLKDLFTNSFKSMRLINEGDEDLDLDNLNKIRQLLRDYEMEMTRVMKNSDNPNCIKRKFNKSTNGKFHSTKGIYM